MDADVREPIAPRQDGDFWESLRRVPCGTSDCGSVSADATSGAFTYGAEAPDGTKMLQIADSVTSILPPTVAVRRVPGYLRSLRWPVPARFRISLASVPEYYPKAMFSAYRSANCEDLRPIEAQPADGLGTGGVGRSSPNERGSLLPRHPTPRPATVRLALGRRTAGRVSSRLRDRSSGRRCRPACRRRGRLRRSSEESSLRVPRLIPTTREGPSRCRDLASPATTPPECARRHASRERRLSSVAHAARRRAAVAGQPERIHDPHHHRQAPRDRATASLRRCCYRRRQSLDRTPWRVDRNRPSNTLHRSGRAPNRQYASLMVRSSLGSRNMKSVHRLRSDHRPCANQPIPTRMSGASLLLAGHSA